MSSHMRYYDEWDKIRMQPSLRRRVAMLGLRGVKESTVVWE